MGYGTEWEETAGAAVVGVRELRALVMYAHDDIAVHIEEATIAVVSESARPCWHQLARARASASLLTSCSTGSVVRTAHVGGGAGAPTFRLTSRPGRRQPAAMVCAGYQVGELFGVSLRFDISFVCLSNDKRRQVLYNKPRH